MSGLARSTTKTRKSGKTKSHASAAIVRTPDTSYALGTFLKYGEATRPDLAEHLLADASTDDLVRIAASSKEWTTVATVAGIMRAKVYVGNLGSEAQRNAVEEALYGFLGVSEAGKPEMLDSVYRTTEDILAAQPVETCLLHDPTKGLSPFFEVATYKTLVEVMTIGLMAFGERSESNAEFISCCPPESLEYMAWLVTKNACEWPPSHVAEALQIVLHALYDSPEPPRALLTYMSLLHERCPEAVALLGAGIH